MSATAAGPTPAAFASRLAGVALALLATGCSGVYERINLEMFKNDRVVSGSPADAGLAFEELELAVGDRVLHGWFVPAASRREDGVGDAVLFFHGVNNTVEDWIDDLRVFHDAGFAGMVFDYSAYGRSSGAADVLALGDDGAVAIAAFCERTPGCRRFVFAHSLGVAVALQAVRRDAAGLHGLVLMSGWDDWRGWLVRSGRVSWFASWFLPALFENADVLAGIDLPCLIVHGESDHLFSLQAPRNLLRAAGDRGRMRIVPDMGHDPGAADATREPWAAIVSYLQSYRRRK